MLLPKELLIIAQKSFMQRFKSQYFSHGIFNAVMFK